MLKFKSFYGLLSGKYGILLQIKLARIRAKKEKREKERQRSKQIDGWKHINWKKIMK